MLGNGECQSMYVVQAATFLSTSKPYKSVGNVPLTLLPRLVSVISASQKIARQSDVSMSSDDRQTLCATCLLLALGYFTQQCRHSESLIYSSYLCRLCCSSLGLCCKQVYLIHGRRVVFSCEYDVLWCCPVGLGIFG